MYKKEKSLNCGTEPYENENGSDSLNSDVKVISVKTSINRFFIATLVLFVVLCILAFVVVNHYKNMGPDNIVAGITNANAEHIFESNIKGLLDEDLEIIGNIYAITNSRQEIVLEGMIKNKGDEAISSFTIDFDLFDEDGVSLGSVYGYLQSFPGDDQIWKFHIPTKGYEFTSFALKEVDGILPSATKGGFVSAAEMENSLEKKLKIIQDAEIVVNENTISIRGKIKNNTGGDAYATKLLFFLYNEDGNMIDATFNFLDVLEKDGIWYYEAESKRDDVASFELFHLTFADYSKMMGDPMPTAKFEVIEDLSVKSHNENSMKITGQIKNTTGKDLGYSRMFVTTYNADGEIIDVELVTMDDFKQDDIWDISEFIYKPGDIQSASVTLIQYFDY